MDQYSHSSVIFRTNGMLQKKLPVVLMFLLFAPLVLLAGCSKDSSSVGPSNSASQIGPGGPVPGGTGPEAPGPGGPTNTIGGIR